MNKVIMMGRLTRDPEIRYSQNGDQMCIARYTLAVDRKFKKQGDGQTADFINCIAFGKTAENCERFLAKGRKVGITGKLTTGSYEKDGVTHYTYEVVAFAVDFLSPASAGAGEQQTSDPSQQPVQAEIPSYAALDSSE